MGWRGLKNKKCLQLRRHQNFASEPRPPSTEFKCNIQLHPRLFRVLGPHFRSHQEPPSRTPAPGASPRPECQVQAPSRPRRSPGTGRRVGDARASAAARTPANRAPLPGSRRTLPPARRAATTQARLGPPRAGGCGVSGGEGGCPASPASLHPPRPRQRLCLPSRPSHSPASRSPLRPLSGLPAASLAGDRREPPPPPPAGFSASSRVPPASSRVPPASPRVPPASPHPREWPGGSQLAAGPPPPLPRCDQWAPAAGKPRPPPGGGGPSGRRAGGRKGLGSGGGGLEPRPPAPKGGAVWTCHVGAAGPAAGAGQHPQIGQM